MTNGLRSMDHLKIKPMSGVRVLDLATFIAAPYAASILGEFGAEVIKIEKPGSGDPWRRFGTATELDNMSLAWLTEARNKKSITLNLQTKRGTEIFKKIVKKSDIICENFRPGTLERWGVGWDTIKEINEKIILMRISGYGQTGPYKDRPGFARIGHSVGGLTYLSGLPGEIPVTPGSTSLGDYMSGLYGAIGILMALRHRDISGKGQVIDIGLYESVFRVLDEIVPRYAKTGFIREPEGTGTVNACPHGHFPSGDGNYLAIACTTDKMFERLTKAMHRPDLFEKFGKQSKRLRNRKLIIKEVTEWTSSRSRQEILEICVSNDVPAGAINTIADIFEDPHFKARQNITQFVHEKIGEISVPSAFPKLSVTPPEINSLGPELGNANDAIFMDELGLSADELKVLKADGVI